LSCFGFFASRFPRLSPLGIVLSGVANESVRVCEHRRTRQFAQERLRRLKPGALDEVAVWIGRLRTMWSDSFDRLDEFLQSENQPTGKGA